MTITGGLTTTGLGSDAAGAADALTGASVLTFFGAADSPLTGGATVDIGAQQVTLNGPVSAAGDIRVLAMGPDDAALNALGPLSAGQDIVLDATNALGSIVATGGLTAGRDVAISSPTTVTVGAVTAGDDAVFVAVDGVTLDGAVATTGATGAQGEGLTLFNQVAAPLDGLFSLTGKSGVFISAASLSNPQAFALSGDFLGISLSDPAGLTLGSTPAPATGVQIDVSTLQSQNVALFASSGGVAIGAATVPNVAPSGPNQPNTFKIYTSGPVTVTKPSFRPSMERSISPSARRRAWLGRRPRSR